MQCDRLCAVPASCLVTLGKLPNLRASVFSSVKWGWSSYYFTRMWGLNETTYKAIYRVLTPWHFVSVGCCHFVINNLWSTKNFAGIYHLFLRATPVVRWMCPPYRSGNLSPEQWPASLSPQFYNDGAPRGAVEYTWDDAVEMGAPFGPMLSNPVSSLPVSFLSLKKKKKKG